MFGPNWTEQWTEISYKYIPFFIFAYAAVSNGGALAVVGVYFTTRFSDDLWCTFQGAGDTIGLQRCIALYIVVLLATNMRPFISKFMSNPRQCLWFLAARFHRHPTDFMVDATGIGDSDECSHLHVGDNQVEIEWFWNFGVHMVTWKFLLKQRPCLGVICFDYQIISWSQVKFQSTSQCLVNFDCLHFIHHLLDSVRRSLIAHVWNENLTW